MKKTEDAVPSAKLREKLLREPEQANWEMTTMLTLLYWRESILRILSDVVIECSFEKFKTKGAKETEAEAVQQQMVALTKKLSAFLSKLEQVNNRVAAPLEKLAPKFSEFHLKAESCHIRHWFLPRAQVYVSTKNTAASIIDN